MCSDDEQLVEAKWREWTVIERVREGRGKWRGSKKRRECRECREGINMKWAIGAVMFTMSTAVDLCIAFLWWTWQEAVGKPKTTCHLISTNILRNCNHFYLCLRYSRGDSSRLWGGGDWDEVDIIYIYQSSNIYTPADCQTGCELAQSFVDPII